MRFVTLPLLRLSERFKSRKLGNYGDVLMQIIYYEEDNTAEVWIISHYVK